MSKAFKAWFKTQTFIPQGDYSYAEIAWDAAVKETKEKAAKVLDQMAEEAEADSEPSGYVQYYREKAAAIRSMK